MWPKGMELVLIFAVVLLLFGPKNLPKLGKSLGSTVKNLREGMAGDDDDAKPAADAEVIEDEDDEVAQLEAKLAEAKAKKAAEAQEVE